MNYYCINYMFEAEKGIYTHLPVTSESTTDLATAEKWFENAVRQFSEKSWARSVVSVEDREYDYWCSIKRAIVICDEAAYMHGKYMIELMCYQHNPVY